MNNCGMNDNMMIWNYMNQNNMMQNNMMMNQNNMMQNNMMMNQNNMMQNNLMKNNMIQNTMMMQNNMLMNQNNMMQNNLSMNQNNMNVNPDFQIGGYFIGGNKYNNGNPQSLNNIAQNNYNINMFQTNENAKKLSELEQKVNNQAQEIQELREKMYINKNPNSNINNNNEIKIVIVYKNKIKLITGSINDSAPTSVEKLNIKNQNLTINYKPISFDKTLGQNGVYDGCIINIIEDIYNLNFVYNGLSLMISLDGDCPIKDAIIIYCEKNEILYNKVLENKIYFIFKKILNIFDKIIII